MSVDYNTENGMSITNVCYECMIIARDVELGFPTGKCQTCMESEEARSDINAWNLHEDDRLGEGKGLLVDTDEPSGHDWISSETYVRDTYKKAIMIEEWDDNCHLVKMEVIFLDTDEVTVRNEFTPPTYNILDGGTLDNLWELDDIRQLGRETECQWCHILTPKAFNDCQSCDHPLELNVR